MKKEIFENTAKYFAGIDPEKIRAVSVHVMQENGDIVCNLNGNDGDLFVMSEIAAEQIKLKMMGFVKPIPKPLEAVPPLSDDGGAAR